MPNLFQRYQNAAIAPETQQKLNHPLFSGDALKKEHENFLGMLIGKIEKRELNPFNSKTLFNRAVYDQLSESEQEKTDLSAINIMGVIRQIEKLWAAEKKPTFQIQNLVETVFLMKSKFEEMHGDVFII